MPDMTPIIEFVPDKPPDTGVLLFGGSSDTNLLKVTPVYEYYAFLDEVEEAYIEAFEEDGWNTWKVIGSDLHFWSLGDKAGTTGHTGLSGPQKRDERQGVFMAYFDCIRAEYFNANIELHRSFYARQFGWDIDKDRDLSWNYQHSPEQTELHRLVNAEFDKKAGASDFISVVALFSNTEVNWKRFRYLCPEEDWIGLRLIKGTHGLPAQVLFGEDRESSDMTHSIKSICTLDPVRLNNLRHVVSLDFARDAYLKEDPELVLPPTPVFVFQATSQSEIVRTDHSFKNRFEERQKKAKLREMRKKKMQQKKSTPVVQTVPVQLPPVIYRRVSAPIEGTLKKRAILVPVF